MKEFKIRASAAGEIMGIKALGKTGESYCQKWIKEQLYNRHKTFVSKYTTKGLIMEDQSIDLVAEYLGMGLLLKNERRFENDFIIGTPDIVTNELIIDVKNSWDFSTFPLFENDPPDGYFYQAQCYMELTGVHKFKLVYTLQDTPPHLIEREAWQLVNHLGYEYADAVQKMSEQMTYGDVSQELKIKILDIDYSPETITKIYERVAECREYIKTLQP